jgi:hypothetical protein
MNTSTRRVLVVFVMILTLGSMAGPALAASPHVVKGPDVSVSGNTLTVTASIAGLGNVPFADFSLDGTVTVSSRCYTRSGNTPQAANKQETINVSETGTFPVRNGRTNVDFEITPLSTLKCPGGQHVVIEAITYDLHLTGPGIDVHITS